MIQALESLGETTLNIRKQSRHRSDESLRPYLSTGEKDQLQMIENLAEKITKNSTKIQKHKNIIFFFLLYFIYLTVLIFSFFHISTSGNNS